MRFVGWMLAIMACEAPESQEHYDKRHAQEQWDEPCHDESTLLATTAGSPDKFKCPNRLHRMEVQVATTSSNEEIGALVLCRCQREGAP